MGFLVHVQRGFQRAVLPEVLQLEQVGHNVSVELMKHIDGGFGFGAVGGRKMLNGSIGKFEDHRPENRVFGTHGPMVAQACTITQNYGMMLLNNFY